MLFLPIVLLAQTIGYTTLVLHHTDGTTTDIALYTHPNVTFTSDKLLISSPVLKMEYPAESVLRFTYKGGTTGITSPSVEADRSQENGQLVFHGVGKDDHIAVYTINGIRVPVSFVCRDNTLLLPLNSVPRGTYILSINGKSSKFTKE